MNCAPLSIVFKLELINQSINQLYLKHGEIISIFTRLQEELKIYIQDNHR